MSNTRQPCFIVSFCLVTFISQSVQAQKMYWTDSSRKKIPRANLDGTQIENLNIEFLTVPTGLALDLPAGKIFWTDNGRLRRANLDGSQEEVLNRLADARGHIALDLAAGKMYWVSRSGTVSRSNLDGSGVELLISTSLTDPFGIALDLQNGKMYLTDVGSALPGVADGRIMRANLDGSALESLITDLFRPFDIALDLNAEMMYWTQPLVGVIARSSFGGFNVERIVEDNIALRPQGIDLDISAGKIYWTDSGNRKIQRANFDGSMVEGLIDEVISRSGDIALDPDACITNFACSDANICTDDVCTNGVCIFSANTHSCTDGNVCTDDVCSEGACVSTPNTNTCDDENQCTNNDVCTDGTCLGQNRTGPCDDEDPCTNDSCVDGQCVGTPHRGACDDGDPCTRGSRCFSDGSCEGGIFDSDVCLTFSLLVTEVNGVPCLSCPTANLPASEVLPGDRLTIEAFISNWRGTDGDTLLAGFAWAFNFDSFTSGTQGILSPATIACGIDADCFQYSSSPGTCTCEQSACETSGFCDNLAIFFFDKSRPDFLFSGGAFGVDGPSGIILSATLISSELSDPGTPIYAGTSIIDSSMDSRGLFSVRMRNDISVGWSLNSGFPSVVLNPVTINFCDVIDSPNDCNGNGIPDECEPDGDGDGVIDACDPCPLDPDDDSDGDGVCDSDDGCPTNPLKIVPGACGCSNPEDDTDGDGVPDCVDLCSGVDDTIFGTQCAGAIPTVSTWGLAILTLLLMVGGKLYFRRRYVAGYVRKAAR